MTKILLIEDEKDAAADIASMLKTRGFQVSSACTGREALKLLQEERFHLAIIDILLPDIQGYDLCAHIRHDTRLKDLPIIVSTAVESDSIQTLNKDLGVNELLIKPYRNEDLFSAIKRCLKQK